LLASALLTIGPRFGGALDEAAKMFAQASYTVTVAINPAIYLSIYHLSECLFNNTSDKSE
jgi:hypothetical protein